MNGGAKIYGKISALQIPITGLIGEREKVVVVVGWGGVGWVGGRLRRGPRFHIFCDYVVSPSGTGWFVSNKLFHTHTNTHNELHFANRRIYESVCGVAVGPPMHGLSTHKLKEPSSRSLPGPDMLAIASSSSSTGRSGHGEVR